MGNIKDYATSTVTTAPSPADSGTSLTVASGHGSRFPAVPFSVTVHPTNEMPTLDSAERLLVTGVSGDTFTVVRAQGDTTAKSIADGWRITNALFKADLDAKADVSSVPTSLDDITEGSTNKHFTATEKSKLSGIAVIPAGESVEDRMTTLLSSIPTTLGAGTSQNYRTPTNVESSAVVRGLNLIAQEAGKAYDDISLTAASALLTAHGFTLSKGIDSVTKRPFALAQAEATYPSSSNYRAWGNYFFDLSQPISMVIEAPHPQTDGNSEIIALRQWQNSPGSVYLMSSVNRKAKDYMVTEISTNHTGGTYTLNVLGLGTTVAIAYNASIATIQAAIETVVGVGNVTVTGDPANTSLHAFVNLAGSLYDSDNPTATITVGTNSLTGGTYLTLDHDADAAHNYNSVFNKFAASLAEQGYAQLQLHGFNDVSSGVPRIFSAIQSRGSSNNSKVGEAIRSALEAAGFDVARKDSFSTQGLYVTGSPTGGTITLTYNSIATSAITYSTNQTTFANNVKAALEAHPSIGTGNIAVTQSQNTNTGVSQALVLTFRGALYHQGLTAITVSNNSLTGGTSPTASGLTAEGTSLTAQSNTQGDIAETYGTIFVHLEMSQTVRTSSTLSAALVAAMANTNLPQISALAMPVLAEAGHTKSQAPLLNGSGATIGTSPVAARADHRHAATINDPTEGDYIRRGASSWTAVSSSQIKTDLALTKSDVGLANADNTSDLSKPVSTATQAALDTKATTTALDAHTSSTANPHSVTKEQVGLGATDNVQFKQITAGTTTDAIGTAFTVIRNNVAVGRIDNNSSGLRVQAQNGALQLRGTGNTGILVSSTGKATFTSDIEFSDTASGVILKSPDGTLYRVTVANGGTLEVAAV